MGAESRRFPFGPSKRYRGRFGFSRESSRATGEFFFFPAGSTGIENFARHLPAGGQRCSTVEQ
jgi:hypothetical protein